MNWTLGPISASWGQLLPRLSDQVTKEVVEVVQIVVSRQITDSEGRRRIGAIAAGECPTDISCAVQDELLESLISEYIEAHPQVFST